MEVPLSADWGGEDVISLTHAIARKLFFESNKDIDIILELHKSLEEKFQVDLNNSG